MATKKEPKLDSKFNKQLLEWQIYDSAIYNHFNATLWRKIEEFGVERMNGEVAALRGVNQLNQKNCVNYYKPVNLLPAEFRDWQPDGIEIDGVSLVPNATKECYRMSISPAAFAIDIQDRQCQSTMLLRIGSVVSDIRDNLMFRSNPGIKCLLFSGRTNTMIVTILLVLLLLILSHIMCLKSSCQRTGRYRTGYRLISE